MTPSPPPPLNPFLYGKPVPADRFHGRGEEIHTLFSRISTSQSTAIVGEPHIGKSSLKRFISDESVRGDWLQEEADSTVFVDVDCHLLPSDHGVDDFWRHVLEGVGKSPRSGRLGSRFLRAAEEKEPADPSSRQTLFRDLGRAGRRAVLLLDEFDVLTEHPKLGSTDFYGPLRTIANNTEGLAVVTASRLSVSELNRRTSRRSTGSPLVNNMIEVKLPALRHDEVDELLAQTLEGTPFELDETDRSFLHRVAGRHPFLVQAAGAALFDAALVDRAAGAERYRRAAARLRQSTESHFDDVWQHLEPQAQIAMVILALAETDGQVHQRDFDTGSLGRLGRYEKELRDLERRGLVEGEDEAGWHMDWGHFALWHGSRWRVGAGSFVWWIADHAVADTRQEVDFGEWLRQRELEGLLTRGEKEKLKELAGKIPKSVLESSASILGTALKGFLR